MVDNPTKAGPEPAATVGDPTRSRPSELPELVSKVVEYPSRPDRRTIFPPGLSGVDRMEQWLTADTDVFVDLETWR